MILEHIQQHVHQQHWRAVLLVRVSKLKKIDVEETICSSSDSADLSGRECV
jgi:hypothetical protein